MIPRRLIRHLKDQTWFAVGLDLVIVVLGVFIGIQVANWNEARQLGAQQQSYLGQLRDEILENHRVVDLRERYNNQVVEADQRGLAYLSGHGDRGEAALAAISGELGGRRVTGAR